MLSFTRTGNCVELCRGLCSCAPAVSRSLRPALPSCSFSVPLHVSFSLAVPLCQPPTDPPSFIRRSWVSIPHLSVCPQWLYVLLIEPARDLWFGAFFFPLEKFQPVIFFSQWAFIDFPPHGSMTLSRKAHHHPVEMQAWEGIPEPLSSVCKTELWPPSPPSRCCVSCPPPPARGTHQNREPAFFLPRPARRQAVSGVWASCLYSPPTQPGAGLPLPCAASGQAETRKVKTLSRSLVAGPGQKSGASDQMPNSEGRW